MSWIRISIYFSKMLEYITKCHQLELKLIHHKCHWLDLESVDQKWHESSSKCHELELVDRKLRGVV